jgi:rod shape-determining protein MreC
MSQLIRLIYKSRNLLIFIILEILSFWLLIKNNSYWDVSFFNTSNYYAAKTLESSNYVKNYMNLGDVNKQLASENSELRKQVVAMQQLLGNRPKDSYKIDSVFATRFDFKVAKVINNTTNLTDNYVTIDKGSLDGIEPGMGVISPQGVVGQVKSCNERMSIVYSILHSRFQVSSEIKNKDLRKLNEKALGIGKWDGANPRIINLTTVDRFKPIKIGDSVMTSEQNSIFPSNIMLGKIRKKGTKPDQPFYDIELELSTDFPNLTYVYIVDNKLKKEQDKLEATSTQTNQ